MLSVLRVHLPSDIPIVGCELTPYVLLRRPDGSITPDDIPESSPVDGFYLKHRWYRIQSDKGIAVCNVHPSEPATLQCLGCIKAKTVSKSYHCSPECFADSWRQHRSLHARAANAVQENGPEEEEMFGSFTGSGSVGSAVGAALLGLSNGSIPVLVSDRGGAGETWYEVGRSRTYTPSVDDVGHVLKLECTAIDSSSGQPVAPASTLLTSRVIPAPSPTPRRMIPLSYMDGMSGLDMESHSSAAGTFTVLSYNVLADLYATSDMYSYCPPWALSWAYRRQNLLREIVGYRADILCLQEVQSDHFDEFFQPELEKHGYVAVYKKKTTESDPNFSAAPMASSEGQLNPSTSGDAGEDHNEDYGNEYGPPLPTQEELREMEHRRLVGEATNLMLNFAKDPKLAKYMTETAFQDVHAQ
ncbi:hypothetical protein L7F22_067778 [Adiantum nelumboides]|nr:hypothetical protein [Adiantum nelumboides]